MASNVASRVTASVQEKEVASDDEDRQAQCVKLPARSTGPPARSGEQLFRRTPFGGPPMRWTNLFSQLRPLRAVRTVVSRPSASDRA